MRIIKDLLFIFVISLFFAGLTVSVNQALSSRISLNEKTRYTKQLLEVLKIPYPGDASPEALQDLENVHIEAARLDGKVVYRGLDNKGNPVGYAFPIGGKGFWGRIDGFLSTENDLNAIRAIVFTSHNETPGLGARIEEPWFRKQFENLQFANAVGPQQYVEISKADSSGKNKLDAITGATMTTKALEKIVNDDLKFILSKKDRLRRIEWESRQKK
jgi:Na+-transporting NADH:ubiquinone oxidoreductase subunit C